MDKLEKQFCNKNHDTFITGRYKDGKCKLCCNERAKRHFQRTYIPHPKIQTSLCSNGHDKDIVGRDKDGRCSECRRIWNLEKAWKNWGIKNTDGSFFVYMDYEQALKDQNGRCANKQCNRHNSEFKKALAVDHDHKTGLFRGLLCGNCNTLLGNMYDNFKIINGLNEYLGMNYEAKTSN